jgi:hypothetical protein
LDRSNSDLTHAKACEQEKLSNSLNDAQRNDRHAAMAE